MFGAHSTPISLTRGVVKATGLTGVRRKKPSSNQRQPTAISRMRRLPFVHRAHLSGLAKHFVAVWAPKADCSVLCRHASPLKTKNTSSKAVPGFGGNEEREEGFLYR